MPDPKTCLFVVLTVLLISDKGLGKPDGGYAKIMKITGVPNGDDMVMSYDYDPDLTPDCTEYYKPDEAGKKAKAPDSSALKKLAKDVISVFFGSSMKYDEIPDNLKGYWDCYWLYYERLFTLQRQTAGYIGASTSTAKTNAKK